MVMNVPMVLVGVLCYLTKRYEGTILGELCQDRGSVPDPSLRANLMCFKFVIAASITSNRSDISSTGIRMCEA